MNEPKHPCGKCTWAGKSRLGFGCVLKQMVVTEKCGGYTEG